jgi:hypothetical protein
MGMGSASSAADTGIQGSGGNSNYNQPNYVAWVVAALVIVGVLIYLRKK